MTKEVLVAEDNTLNFELVRAVLDAQGCNVSWAKDGLEAVTMASTGAYDLLLLDLHMPHLDGFDVIRRLRAQPPPRPLRVVVLTADAMPHVREQLMAGGADGVLTKPLDLQALVGELRSSLA